MSSDSQDVEIDQDAGGSQDAGGGQSAGTRGGLALAWMAFQLVRLLFLPIIVIGAGMRYAEQRSARHGVRQASYVKPAPTGTRDL